MRQARITIRLAKIRLWFIIVTPTLALLGFASEVVDHLYGFSKRDTVIRMFNMVMECNIPNWYASALLLACAGLLTAIALAAPPGKGGYRKHWAVLALSVRSRRRFVLAALLYVGGALGTEFYVNYWVSIYGTDPVYGMINIVQESIELAGLAVFFVALLGYMRENFSGLHVVVE